MTIFVINPNASSSMTNILEQESAGLLGVHHALRFVTSVNGPASIEGHSDGVYAAYHLTQMVRDIESTASLGEVNAYVIACFDDTGLDAVRELTKAPVIAIKFAEALVDLKLMTSKTMSYQFPEIKQS